MKQASNWFSRAALVIGLLTVLAGCKPSPAVKQAQSLGDGTRNQQPASRPPSVPLDQATLGTVSGTVRPPANPPARVKIDMSMDPVCSITGAENLSEQYVVHNGGLANVYIYLKSGPPQAMEAVPLPGPPVVLDQVGCRYTPHVIALAQGGSVEFRNSDGTMHNIHTMPTVVGEEPIDVSQGPKGAPVTRQFTRPEIMMPIRCNNHPWMNAFLNVSATPFFAVSDADGHFTLTGLPPGTYTLAAVHEKLGEQDLTVTIAPKATAKADFSFNTK